MFFLLITHFFHRKMRIFGKKEFYDQIILWILSIHIITELSQVKVQLLNYQS